MLKELWQRLKQDLAKKVSEHIYTVILAIITIVINAYKNSISKILDIEIPFKITGNTIVYLLTIITVTVWVIEVKTREKYKFFPKKVKHKYMYDYNRIRFVYNTEKNIDFCRRSIVKALSPEFEGIIGDYSWNGESIEDIYLDRNCDKKFFLYEPKIEYKWSTIEEENGIKAFKNVQAYPCEGKYKIAIKEPIKLKHTETIDLAFKLIEKDNQKKQYIGIIVQRPTKKLELSVEFCKNLNPIKIRAKKRLIFGDKTCETLNPKYISISEKGYGENFKKVYTLSIQKPSIFCNYYLEWYFELNGVEDHTIGNKNFEGKILKKKCKF